MRVIKCSHCGYKETYSVSISFDDYAKMNEWTKKGKFYFCPKCEKKSKQYEPKPKKISERDEKIRISKKDFFK